MEVFSLNTLLCLIGSEAPVNLCYSAMDGKIEVGAHLLLFRRVFYCSSQQPEPDAVRQTYNMVTCQLSYYPLAYTMRQWMRLALRLFANA